MLNLPFSMKGYTVDLWTTGFELHGSTYVWIFFPPLNTYKITLRTVESAGAELQTGQANSKVYVIFDGREGQYPNSVYFNSRVYSLK